MVKQIKNMLAYLSWDLSLGTQFTKNHEELDRRDRCWRRDSDRRPSLL
jgi:hypothetical protein